MPIFYCRHTSLNLPADSKYPAAIEKQVEKDGESFLLSETRRLKGLGDTCCNWAANRVRYLETLFMQKQYVNPAEVFVNEAINNRTLNQSYIGDLADSMLDKGFLAEYAIDVFRSENLAMIETELPYVCACGNHRTRAAQAAKLETVPVNIHPGREEAFIEMMHLDNFKFDPIQNSEIGQPFTLKEKRAAVTQLLMLPKFFKMTDTALSEMWRIPRRNIGRWRGEVIQLLETNSPKLRLWGISDGRLARLSELAAKPERVNDDGKVVKIRQPVVEPTLDEKKSFWDQIKADAGGYNDGWLKDSGIEDFDYIRDYAKQKYDAEESWQIYRYLTMRQMKDIHAAILSDDPQFKETVLQIADEDRKTGEIRSEIKAISEKVKKWLLKQVSDSEWSKNFKDARADFQDTVRAQGFFDNSASIEYHFDPYDYKFDDINIEARQAVMDTLQTIWNQIDLDSFWVVEFRSALEEKVLKKRRKLIADWKAAKQELLDALAAYARPIDLTAFCMALDDETYEPSGTSQRIMDTDEPSNRVHGRKIEEQIDNLKVGIDGLKNDAEWVHDIPAAHIVTETETPLIEIFDSIKNRYPLDTRRVDEKRHDAKMNALASLSGVSIETRIFILADIGVHFAKILEESE